MDDLVTVAAVLALCVAGSSAGVWVVRRMVSPRSLVDANPASGAVFATFGVIYGVILGQVVVAAWSGFQDAESAVDREAQAVVSMVRLADGLPEPERGRIQRAAIAYGEAVAATDWPRMQTGQPPSEDSENAVRALFRETGALAAGPLATRPTTAAIVEKLDDLDAARGERVQSSLRSMPRLLWVALLAGGALTVGFTFLFGLENAAVHQIVVAALSAIVSLLLVVVIALGKPFQPPLSIGPDNFQTRVDLIAEEAATPLATPSP